MVSWLSESLCIAEGDNAAGEEQMEVAAAASGSKRGADGERRDDDKVMKLTGYLIHIVSNLLDLFILLLDI